jgi:CubicO group peptidase (beta-lactamase class C family)
MAMGCGRRIFPAFLAVLLAAPPAHADINPRTAAAIDSFFQSRIAPQGPGCVLGLIRGATVVHWRGYGLADVEAGTPFTPQTVFATGSVYKHFYSASLLLLARKGKLSLADDIRRYLPEIPDYGAPITVRQLLDHTHGLREYPDLFSLAPPDAPSDEPAILSLLGRQRAPAAAPGARFQYGSTGPFLAGIIIARVSGESAGEFTARHVLDPLGMRSTSLGDTTRAVPPRIAAYEEERDGSFARRPPSRGFRTTIQDLARWNGHFDTADTAWQSVLRELTTPAPLRDGTMIDYGLGLRVAPYRGLARVWAPGGGRGHRAMFMRFPDAGLTITLGCNHGLNPITAAEAVADLVLAEEIARAAPALAPAADRRGRAITSSQRRAFAGSYVSETGHVVEIVLRGDRPHLRFEGAEHELFPLGAQRYGFRGVAEIPSDPVSEIVFKPAGRGASAVLEFRTNWYPIRFSKIERPRSEPVPADYLGEYASDEVGSAFRVAVRDGRLTLAGLRGEHVMEPLSRDLFQVGPTTLRFREGPHTIRFERREGRVVRALVSRGQVARLPFTRRPLPGAGAQSNIRP